MFGIKKNLNVNLIEDEIKLNSNTTSNSQSIYQQDLDENDNKYIYYKNNKEFTKKIEIFVKATNNPKKKKIIVIDETASMEFLHLKILESFEKISEYQSLEGLKLESIKKENSNENLPLKGTVKDHIKNGDLLLCEINANEIWVSTRITLYNSFYDKIIFTCDIKIRKNMKVGTFKEIVYKIGFNIFLKKYNTLGKSKLNGLKGDRSIVHFIVTNAVFDFSEEDDNKNLEELVNDNSEIKIVIDFKLLENAIFNRFQRIYLDETNSEISSGTNSFSLNNNSDNINKIGNNIKINFSINNRYKNEERWKMFKNLSFINLLKNNKFANERNYIFYIAKNFCEKYEINKGEGEEEDEDEEDENEEKDNEKLLLKNFYVYKSSKKNSKSNNSNSNENENKKNYIVILNPNEDEIESEEEEEEEENEEEEEEEEEEEKLDNDNNLNKSIISNNINENKNNKKIKFDNRPSINSEKSDNILMNNKNKNDFKIFKNNNFIYKKKLFNSNKTLVNYFFKKNQDDLISDFEKIKKKVFVGLINEEKKINIIKGSIEKIEIPELRNKKFTKFDNNSFDLKIERNNYSVKNVLIEIFVLLILFIIFSILIYFSFKKYVY